MFSSRLLPVCLLALCLLGGCDLFRDTAVVATGTVLDASLNRPAQGVSVALTKDGGAWGAPITVASTRTDAEGRFRLEYDPGRHGANFSLEVNTVPYDETYYTTWYGVRSGGRSDRTTSLYRNATLTVTAEPAASYPGNPDTSVYLWLPGTGGRYPPALTTTRARGNAYNEVRVVYSRGSLTREVIDSVYCPVGVVTEHTVRY